MATDKQITVYFFWSKTSRRNKAYNIIMLIQVHTKKYNNNRNIISSVCTGNVIQLYTINYYNNQIIIHGVIICQSECRENKTKTQINLHSYIKNILFKSLDIDKGEWLEDIERGDSSSASFLGCVEECISERESRRFEEGLNTKVKLDIYKRFGKSVEFKKYLHGVCDAGSRLLFKFRSVRMV